MKDLDEQRMEIEKEIMERARLENETRKAEQILELTKIITTAEDEPVAVYSLVCHNCKEPHDIDIMNKQVENQITLRKIEEFWYENYSDIPLDGMLRKFVDWLQEDK